jgi:hypothetical protein
VFVLADGRIAVFDPMPRWLVPRSEDLCRFLVSLRMQGLTLLTRGWSEGARRLDRRERLVIDGYRADEPLPMPQLRCYQLLITLDKWSALLTAPRPGGRRTVSSRVRDASVLMSSDYFRSEARRLLDLAGSEPG